MPNFTSHENNNNTRSSFAPDASGNSSLQSIWAEDCCADDVTGSFLNTQEDLPSPPPPATLIPRPFPRSIIPPSSDQESYPSRHSRPQQRSLTALLPFRNLGTNPQGPLVKEKLDLEFIPTLTGDKGGQIKVEDRSQGRLSGWFSGTSAPVSVGLPSVSLDVEQTRPSTMSSPDTSPTRDPSPERIPAKLRKRATLPNLDPSVSSPTKPAASSTSRFNFFSSPKTPVKTVQLPADLNNDDFLTLDVSSALFPSGAPSAQDPFSPAAFKNLLVNADGLFLKLQTAYKLRTLSLHELSAESEAQADELEEAEARTKCLKNQLEDMAAQLAAQDEAIQDLGRQLTAEKQARAAEKVAREKSIILVKSPREDMARAHHLRRHEKTGSCCSIPHDAEDLGIPHARDQRDKQRGRTGSTDLSTGGESGDESGEVESLFSRSRSPALTCSSDGTLDSTPELLQASIGRVVQNPNVRTDRPKMVQRPSTFQKILKGISSVDLGQSVAGSNEMGGIGLENGCNNCRGKDASVAWDTVGLLRAENRGLKDRVGVLEVAVEGALDLCDGLGL